MAKKQGRSSIQGRDMFIGVDTGGTFTDVVLVSGARVWTYKTPSTPADFAKGVVNGIKGVLAQSGLSGPFELVHSSTVATNALLERKGAKTALITTMGFRDVLEIGRQNRPELYNLNVTRPQPLVPRALRFEVNERVNAQGEVLHQLDEAGVENLLDKIASKKVESLAISLLFSFLNPQHEATIQKAASKRGLIVSTSSEIIPEFREYERTSTTVANAFVSPVMQRYLKKVQQQSRTLGAERLRIVQSNGGSLSAKAAGGQAVQTLLSGPAAGIIGAFSISQQALAAQDSKDNPKVKIITFDMGGTSTDVALVDGAYKTTTESEINGCPVRVPMIDIHTVGAGGGSIAWVDAGGALHVGPESSGADPGPACYGKGEHPTVTDANLVLNRLDPAHFLGGRFELHPDRAFRVMKNLGKQMNCDEFAAAQAVIQIVNSNMERAIRVISVERGHDPRDFTLVPFGGAGGLHVCELTSALHIPRVLLPRHPGVLSAWGALSGDVVKHQSKTVMLPFTEKSHKTMDKEFERLRSKAVKELKAEGFSEDELQIEPQIDIRYVGQSYELTVPLGEGYQSAAEDFHNTHRHRFGHAAPGEPIEAVTLRLRASGVLQKPELEPIERGKAGCKRAIIGQHEDITLYERQRMRYRNTLQGPALIFEDFSTTFIPAGWSGSVDQWGHIHLTAD